MRAIRSVLVLFVLIATFARVHSPVHAGTTDAKRTLPNILWITSEDNSAHWLGCYGNEQAKTPRLDTLAAESVLFEHAYSNAPVCAVARSTILHGVYAVSSGTQHMRSRHRIPKSFKPYVSYLRDLGYYCTNNSKTDYNRAGSDKAIWDACNGKAHYKNRQPEQPFFAIFNLTVSHESCLFPENVKARRERGLIPQQPRVPPEQVILPPYLPDLPEIRADIALYHDYITALDKQVGRLLDELATAGLDDDTIVFYYADHGGAVPRGKRYLTDTGVRVPMIVHVPEKWRHLSSFQSSQRTDELVAFVDLAPTLLSLVGVEKPAKMQGRAFLGEHRSEPTDDDMVFLFADRFDELYGMRRGLTDGRFKYIRRFTPHLPAAPCSDYSLGQPGWAAWQRAWQAGELEPSFRQLWEAPQASEELYDLHSDPWEVTNLAHDPAQADRLAMFRQRLQQKMLEVRDTGVVPEPMFTELAGEKTIAEFVRSDSYDYPRVLQAAWNATRGEVSGLSQLQTMLSDESPVVRYWGTLGCAILGEQASSAAARLKQLGDDPSASVRMTAAMALAQTGDLEAGKAALLDELETTFTGDESVLFVNLVGQLDCLDEIPKSWIEKVSQQESASPYFRRFVKRLQE